MIRVDKLDDRVKGALLALLDSVEREDEYLRLQQMRQFKKNNLFWHGFQYLFWSDTDQDWRVPTHQEFAELSSREETRWIFDYVVNHFKAHGEAIIAALSADIPNVRFGPRDADDPDDRRAVTAADTTADSIERFNRSKLLIINALFYLATEGFVASYTYHRKDKEYGTYSIPQYDTKEQPVGDPYSQCPQCGQTDVTGTENCSCGEQMDQVPAPTEIVPFMAGEKLVSRGKDIIEIYGPLNVRVPSYVSKQADAGYLVHYVDADPALFKGMFPDVADEIDSDPGQTYERIMRQTSLSMDGYQLNIRLATQKKCWFRPWMLNRLKPEFDDIQKKLVSIFPDGIYFSVIGQVICEARNESMDDHWSLTKAGPSKGVHADPLLQSLVPLQELRNNLTNLFVMQVEYGVPATFADPEVFDFEGQAQQEVAPGYTYSATPRPGQTLAQAFYDTKTSSLNKESTQLLGVIGNDEQFVVGSFPSIYGGPAQGGSKTLGEYDKSRAFALQRLGLVYYFIDVWWGETIHKAVRSFITHQVEDEPLTEQVSGGWQTRWIRRADFRGSFERLDPEASADFPVSFSQKRQSLMALLQLNNPQINSVLFAPENAGFISSVIAMDELKLPAELQRRKQIRELMYLIGLESQQGPDGQMVTTVPTEPNIDDDNVHIDVLVDFMLSDTGQDLKEQNPGAYNNCMAHLLEHKKNLMAKMPPPMPAGPPQAKPQGAPAPARPRVGVNQHAIQ